MSFGTLALIIAVALTGPLLAWSDRLRLPVIVGELAAGVVIGTTGFGAIDPHEPLLAFMANLGFAMVMFVAGSRIPVRNKSLLKEVRVAMWQLLLVVVAAVVLGWVVAVVFRTGHAALYAVLFASSSAAVIMPLMHSLGPAGRTLNRILPQVAVADAVCIVALPLVLHSDNAGRAALGVIILIACTVLVFLALLWSKKSGGWVRLRAKSKARAFALELRVSVLVLALMAALAQYAHVSILLAGFGLGLAVAAVGQPQRLARQLFALTEGLFGPIFFVWLGASLDLRDLATHPAMIGLGVALAAGALAAHATAVVLRLRLSAAVISAAQLGVPVAAVTTGYDLGVLQPGEGAAMLLGALLTIAATALAWRHVARSGSKAPAEPGQGGPGGQTSSNLEP